MHSADYSSAVGAVDAWLSSAEGMPPPTLAEADTVLRELADVPPTAEQIVSKGMPWGGLHEKLRATLQKRRAGAHGGTAHGGTAHGSSIEPTRLAPGCPFPPPEVTEETAAYLELLEVGTFSNATLRRPPTTFEVSAEWMGLVEASARTHGRTWLHSLLLGTAALEHGDAAVGGAHLRDSMARKPSVHAARALALLAPSADAACAAYLRAWALWEALDGASDGTVRQLGADLSGEIAGWMLLNERWAELRTFLARLRAAPAPTPRYLLKDRALHAAAALAVHDADHATAIALLRGHCFPTYGSMRSELIQLWHAAQALAAEHAKGAPLSVRERLALRKRFRCDGDATNRKLDDKCLNGPPNLGYAY